MRQKRLRKPSRQRQQSGGHCHNGGRDDSGLNLGEDNGVNKKEMDLGAIHEVGLVGFHDLVGV